MNPFVFVLSFIVGCFVSEVITDLLVIKIGTTKGERFKLRINPKALNPFIDNDKALTMYFFEVIIAGLIVYYLQEVFEIIVSYYFYYYIPIVFLAITCLYVLGIKKLKIKMTANKWIIFGILVLLTIGLFFIFYWIGHPQMFQNVKNLNITSQINQS